MSPIGSNPPNSNINHIGSSNEIARSEQTVPVPPPTQQQEEGNNLHQRLESNRDTGNYDNSDFEPVQGDGNGEVFRCVARPGDGTGEIFKCVSRPGDGTGEIFKCIAKPDPDTLQDVINSLKPLNDGELDENAIKNALKDLGVPAHDIDSIKKEFPPADIRDILNNIRDNIDQIPDDDIQLCVHRIDPNQPEQPPEIELCVHRIDPNQPEQPPQIELCVHRIDTGDA